MSTTSYVQLGHSGLFVHRLGLGTMQFGWSVDEAGSFDVLDAYVEAGGNFIDTADIYSSWAEQLGGQPQAGGVSEEILGRWLADRGVRDEVVVATKVRGAMGRMFSQGRDTVHQREGLGRGWIMRACEDSLRRLQVDHIDLYQVHWIDPLVPIAETLGALTDLVHQGKVRYLGCSNFSAWRIVESLWEADRRNLERFVSVQPEYHLLQPTRFQVEGELAGACMAHGIGMVPYSPLAGGMLTGKYRRGQVDVDSMRADENLERRATPTNFDIIEELADVAAKAGMSMASAAVSWLLTKPWVTAPIIGANRPAQLRDTMSGVGSGLDDELVARLDAVGAMDQPRFVQEA